MTTPASAPVGSFLLGVNRWLSSSLFDYTMIGSIC